MPGGQVSTKIGFGGGKMAKNVSDCKGGSGRTSANKSTRLIQCPPTSQRGRKCSSNKTTKTMMANRAVCGKKFFSIVNGTKIGNKWKRHYFICD